MRRNRTFAIAALCAVLPFAPAGAQSVRGVTVGLGDTPVAGVVVQLVDSGSAVAARALSNERGEFRFVGIPAGTYRLRTLRIGFRPTVSAPFQLRAGEDVTRRLELAGLIFALDTVRVGARNMCSRAANDSLATTYAVWEQARIALTAAELTARSRDVIVTLLSYARVLDPSGNRVISQATAVRSDSVAQPWVSLAVDSLRRLGYVSNENDSTVYRAPGLDMLVSDVFLDDHCFRLVASPTDKSRLGIAFEPTSARRKVAEVKGTLWLDRASSELRTVEFSYVNTAVSQQERDAGGSADFARMSDGSWVITKWHIQMPTVALRMLVARGIRVPVPTVVDLHLSGGELALARRGADTLWSRPTVTLTGTVTDSISGAKVSAARIEIADTRLGAMTDSTGRFSLRGALPGDYIVEVRTPSLDSMNAVQRLPLTVTDSVKPLSIRVPDAQLIATAMCGAAVGRGVSGTPGIIAGTVDRVGDSTQVPRATVMAEWVEGADKQQRWIETHSDSLGRYRLCGLPLNTTLTLRATADTGSSLAVAAELGGGVRFSRVPIPLDRTLAGGAVFSGIAVVDSTLEPIAGAEVVITGLGRSVRTSANGRFRVGGIPAGIHEVTIRKLGFGPASGSIAFTPNQRVERRVVLGRVSVLDEVKITAASLGPWYKEFEDNKRLGLGKFFTREDLKAVEGHPLVDLLYGLPSVRIPKGGDQVASSRKNCWVHVYLDNTLLYGGRPGEAPPSMKEFPPESVEALEYYPGPSSTPPKYSNLNAVCGVLVIHTRQSP